ncbi:MAG: hypothetical protein AAF202_00270, partial [Pseudomonadota bacterium]
MAKSGFWNSLLIVILSHCLMWTPLLTYAHTYGQPFRQPANNGTPPGNSTGATVTPSFASSQMLGITPNGRADFYWGFGQEPIAGREISAREMQRRIGHLEPPKPLTSQSFELTVNGRQVNSSRVQSIPGLQAVMDEYLRAMRWLQIVAPNEQVMTKGRQLVRTITNTSQLSQNQILREQIRIYRELVNYVSERTAPGASQTNGARAVATFNEAKTTLTDSALK